VKHYTIRHSDIGAPTIRAFGSTWLVQNFMGRILYYDIGKRVYLADGRVLQIESDDQLEARWRKEDREGASCG
jgi:hypothetical protein